MKAKLLIAIASIVLSLISSKPAIAAVTLGTTAVAAANIYQGTNTNVIYIVSMSVTSTAVTATQINFTFSGSQDANDFSTASVYYNTTPSISGASFKGSTSANFAAGHTYSINISQAQAAGTTGYFLITINVNSNASDNKTVRITGATTPVTFGFSGSVSVTNNQNNNAGLQTIQAADVALSTTAVPAATLYQGTNTNLVYITKMVVTTATLTATSIQFTLSGTHDANDLGSVSVYFNTTPSLTGASFKGSATANFAAPHAYSININNQQTAGSTGYFLITVNVNSSATDNKNVRITGATTPVTFGYSTSPNITNTQNNGGGLQTIQAADVALSTTAVPAATLYQGTNTNLVYIAKMVVTTANLTATSIQFTLSGTHDANDLGSVSVYFNTTPSLTGASFKGSATANFAAPHAYSININNQQTAGSTGYFLITVNVNSSATDNKTVRITGATTPVTFGYSTSPNITNTQNNGGGLQTIQAADVALSTTAVPAATLYQGTNTNLVYIAKMVVTTANLTATSIQFTLSGTHDADDLGSVSVYFNTTPSLTGASFKGSATANFAAPHLYSININNQQAAGSTGYFLITVNVNSSATDNKNVRITGATTPVTFGYSTSPNVTNTQNNGGGLQTIQAADVALSTTAVPAATLYQGTNTNLVYITKMVVTTATLTATSIQFTLSGTHDANDLGSVSVYFNTTPSLSGASFKGSATANFAAPHAYSININNQQAAGSTGYFLITVNVNSSATDNKNVRITGATTPVTFGYSTSPNVTNTQNNGGGLQTIQAADITLTTSPTSAGNIARGSNNNIVYIAKMAVATAQIVVNNIQFTLGGTHDADDLGSVSVYFNTTPSLTGASFKGSATANFAAPHLYSININNQQTAGSTGYFLITVNVNATASIGKTVLINGNTTPVTFGYSTSPNVTNSQTNTAGTKTISASALQQMNEILVVEKMKVSVYPNPVNSRLNYSLVSESNQKVKVQLSGITGKVYISREESLTTGKNDFSYAINHFANGNYRLIIINEKNGVLLSTEIRVQH